MKFMVIVNQKYLVTVEANTHGGAEHKILSGLYYGIETCQAFTIAETITDTFKALVENCETISYAEMKEKSNLYQKIKEEKTTNKLRYEKNQKLIKELYQQIELLKDDCRIVVNNMETCDQELKEIW